MAQYLCLVTVLSCVDGPSPQPPPLGIWGPTDPRPTPPIAMPPGGVPGQPPLGIWGPTDPRPGYGLPGNQPYPDNSLPGQPPRPWGPTDPRPTPPIYIPPAGGQPPLGIWGPTDPRPGTGLPGNQPYPDQGLPPHPAHPIVLPPGSPPTVPGEGGGPERKVEWKTGWTAETGWVIIGIPAEGTLVPTPS
jgi:hypothetical protein